MCGRYSITTAPEAMRQLFGYEARPNFPPRYNVAPTQMAPVVRLGPDGRREPAMLRWGLVPSWAKDPKIGARLINARSDTVAVKPSFRAAFRKRRCLVPADGFYEWRAGGKLKQPYRVTLADGEPFAMAGLWESWRANTSDAIESFCILTTSANERLAEIHDRMPVILHEADFEAWLGSKDEAKALAVLRPYPAERTAYYAVSRRVNSPKFDDPECIAPVTVSA
jgi:putative SOS response-associated peptidase YedK